jgi:hypothetical protein
MDLVDTLAFVSWSALMYAIAGFDGWWLLGLQAGYLLACCLGRKVVDIHIERRN